MRMPGTNWCGRGWRAERYRELGTHAGADACCRQHDLTCVDSIQPGETKNGLHNYRPYTAMHCSCDERYFKLSNLSLTIMLKLFNFAKRAGVYSL